MTHALSILVHVLLVIAGAFAVFLAVLSYFKFERLMHQADSADDPLNPRDAFTLKIGRRLGITRVSQPFGVAVIECAGAANLAERIRRMVRHGDDVIALAPDRAGLIADVPTDRHPDPIGATILRRIQGALAAGRDGQAALPSRAAWLPWNLELEEAKTRSVRTNLPSEAAALLAAAEQRLSAAALFDPAAPPPPAPPEEPHDEEEMAYRDPLTGLLKPAKMGAALNKFIARLRRYDQPATLLYVDVDQLEAFNGAYGPEAGDDALRQLGQILNLGLREKDLVGRLGEDDFMAVLKCPVRGGEAAAARIVERAREVIIVSGPARLRFSISVGIAGAPDHGETPRELLHAAERALFAARDRGHNLCVVYDRALEKNAAGARPS